MFEPQTVSRAETQPRRPWHLLTLSAQSHSALEAVTAELVNYLRLHPSLDVADVAYSSLADQRAFAYRRAVVCKSIDDAVETLESQDPKRVLTAYQESQDRQMAFMFPGSGSQYVYMGFGLYRTEALFQEQIDICSELLLSRFGFDLRHILYPSREQVKQAAKQLNELSYGSLALFVTEYALAKLWIELGIVPKAMIGHSLGEYVAACLAGVFSLEDALVLVFTRARLLQSLSSGAMLTVSLPEEKVLPFLNRDLSLSAVNAPESCVVAGTSTAIEALQDELTRLNIDCLKLGIGVAGHSQQMQPVVAEFATVIKDIELKPARVPYISNVTGTWIQAGEATNPDFWVQHLCQTVRFAAGLDVLLADAHLILLEVGPGLALTSFARMHSARMSEQLFLPSLRHFYERISDSEFLLKTLGRLWLAGNETMRQKLYLPEQCQHVSLPTTVSEPQNQPDGHSTHTDETTQHGVQVVHILEKTSGLEKLSEEQESTTEMRMNDE